jgi:chemotaxis protein methyltransferase CheR
VDAEMTAMSVDGTIEPELDLLLDEIYARYHYDFRHYSRVHVRRRVAHAQAVVGSPSAADLLERVLGDPEAFGALLRCMTIQVSDLFRDPGYYAALREKVLPHLATYPSVRIWVAGCGTGEEAYSLAIILAEAGLLDRSFIYATDIDAESLRIGQAGTYEVERVRGFTENYFRAGGQTSLSDYYTAAYSRVAFSPRLRKHILFSDHSLATDAAFAEVQLVSCRNVFIYFERELQDRALSLFQEALCPRGFLGLGAKETLAFSSRGAAFEPFALHERVYRMR